MKLWKDHRVALLFFCFLLCTAAVSPAEELPDGTRIDRTL